MSSGPSLDPLCFRSLEADDAQVAERSAKQIAEYCDVFIVGKDVVDENRAKAGQVQGIWVSFQGLFQHGTRQPESDSVLWGCNAIGYVCFGNLENCRAVSEYSELLDSLADIMRNGSPDEKAAAAGAIANVCSVVPLRGKDMVPVGDETSKRTNIAEHANIVSALLSLCQEPGKARMRAVGAFANMSRSDAVRAVLIKNEKVLEILQSVIPSEGSGDEHEVLKARATMALANLTGRSEETKIIARPEVLHTLVMCLQCAVDSHIGEEKRMFGGVVWTVQMALHPIYQLSIADIHKCPLVQSGVVVPLLRLLCAWKEGQPTQELEWSLLTLQQLAFDHDCKSEIAAMVFHPEEQEDYPELPHDALEAFERVSHLDPPSELELTRDTGRSLGQLSKNLMVQIDKADLEDRYFEEFDEDDKNRWIMISYNWDVQEQAKELCALLQSEGFTVWMDILEGCMAGDTLQAMADAVGHASVVLILVTLRYKESANCRREASYAHDLKKPIIPIIMEQDYRPDGSWGWLGLIIAGKLYYNLADDYKREDQITELLKAPELTCIPRNGLLTSSVSISSISNRRILPPISSPTSSITMNEPESQTLGFIGAKFTTSDQSIRSISPQRSLVGDGSAPNLTREISVRNNLIRQRRASVGSLPSSGDLGIKISSAMNPNFSPPPRTALLSERKNSGVQLARHTSVSGRRTSVLSRSSQDEESIVTTASTVRQASARRINNGGKRLTIESNESYVSGSSPKYPCSDIGGLPEDASEVDTWLASLHSDLLVYSYVFERHRLNTLDMIAELTQHDMDKDIEPAIPAVGHRVLIRRGLAELRKSRSAKKKRTSQTCCVS